MTFVGEVELDRKWVEEQVDELIEWKLKFQGVVMDRDDAVTKIVRDSVRERMIEQVLSQDAELSDWSME